MNKQASINISALPIFTIIFVHFPLPISTRNPYSNENFLPFIPSPYHSTIQNELIKIHPLEFWIPTEFRLQNL